MKKNLLFLSLLITQFAFAQVNYKSENVKLLGTWDNPDITPNGSWVNNRFSSCWGYADKGKEYAVVGAQNGTYIVNITNPANPVLVKNGFIAGKRDKCIWREYKTYKNYLYCISDDGGQNSLQIVDMSHLPDSAKVIYDKDDLFVRGHTISIDKNRMYIAAPKFKDGTSSVMSVFDLTDPTKPLLLRNLKQDDPTADFTHDMYVLNDTCYSSSGNSGLHIYHLQADKTFKKIGSLVNYPFKGYNHTTMMLPDKKHMVMLDEVPKGLPIKVINVSDLTDIKTLTTFTSGSKATPHNPFPAPNGRVAITYYEDGVQIFDLSNPSNPKRTGFFDPHFQSDSLTTTGEYVGVWSVYSELPSKNMVVVDMQNGLFIVDPKKAYGITTSAQDIENQVFASVSPNPFSDKITLQGTSDKNTDVVLIDLLGRTIFSAKNIALENYTIPTSHIAKGAYILRITAGNQQQIQKLMKSE